MRPLPRIWIILLCLFAVNGFAQNKTADSSSGNRVQLKTVHIIQYNFFKDSLRFREEYDKEMNFRRAKWYEVYRGMSVDINKLYHVTQIKKNRKKANFRKMLLNKEQEMFVSNVYTPTLVNKVTQLEGDSLQRFMQQYNPGYAFVKNATTYDLYEQIKKYYQDFTKPKGSLNGSH
ncbi:hypothetical protein CLV51_10228 [Chitinophaga niastensis]|uniref:Uncharacterized protein n=1 Tax=Chitinophaga niastensis TaxID=536980 RepID=A0A2P8HLU5_CHINA|nr:hypothetical protein [Chitinophaga niastensis]PSL47183.1 hypothetical protein CLV51_10228 [Chitinophaga niastensis]